MSINFGLINITCVIPWWAFFVIPVVIIGIIIGLCWYWINH